MSVSQEVAALQQQLGIADPRDVTRFSSLLSEERRHCEHASSRPALASVSLAASFYSDSHARTPYQSRHSRVAVKVTRGATGVLY